MLYQSIIIKLFNNIITLHILDCIYASISSVLIYLIANRIFKNSISAFISSLLYVIGFFASAYCGVLTNQHLFTMLILFLVYFIVKKEYISTKQSFVLGITLAIANIIRPESILYLLGVIIYLFLNMKNKYDIKKFFINTLVILATYIVIIQATSLIIQKTNINQNGLANKNTLWKFVCGLDYNSGGSYSKKGELIFNDANQELDFILDNLKMPLQNYIRLAINKITIFWQNNDYNWVLQNNSVNSFDNINKYDLIEKINIYDKILYLLTIFLLLLHLTNIIIQRHFKQEELLLMIIIILNFFVYLIIEVQSRYSYTVKIFLYILAAGGINYIINLFSYIKKNLRTNLEGTKYD